MAIVHKDGSVTHTYDHSGYCTCGTVNIVKAKYRGMVYPCNYCKAQAKNKVEQELVA